MYWCISHYPAGDAPSRGYARTSTRPRGRQAEPRRRNPGPLVGPSVALKEEPMDLNRDAMLVGLRITAWSGRLYDREASDHVAVHHDATTSAGRYNKRLLPKAAFAALTATMSEARTRHYANSLPWDDKGSRLLTVANYERYTELMDGLRERVVRQRARFIEDYDDYVNQARLDLGKLFRIKDYPSKEALRDKFSISYRITPVPDADHFIAKLASDDTDRVKRNIERHIEEQLHDAVSDLYRRLAEAVERVSERLEEDDNGKPLVFRDTMISNIRDLVDVVPRLNIFGDDRLARLCEQVKDRIAGVEPDSLRPSRTFDPMARDQVKRDADALMEQFRRLLLAAGRTGPGGGVMSAPMLSESALRVSDCVTGLLRKQPLLRESHVEAPASRRSDTPDACDRRTGDPLFAPLGRGDRYAPHRDRDGARGDGVRAQASHPPGRAGPGTLADGLAARHPRAAARCRLHAPARRRSLGGPERRAGIRPPARPQGRRFR